MNEMQFDELLKLAAQIMHFDAIEGSLTDRKEWKKAKTRYDELEATFKIHRDIYVESLLVKDGDWSAVPSNFEQKISDIEKNGSAKWLPAIQYMRQKISPHLNKEAKKSPLRRDTVKAVIKWGPWVFGIAVVSIYFGIRFTSGIEINSPIESKLGIQQRAAAFTKVMDYDDNMDTRVRRGGFLKGIILWPVEPTEKEMQGASEFVSLTLGGYDALAKNGSICGTLGYSQDNKLSDAQLYVTNEVARYVQQSETVWKSPPIFTVLEPLKSKYPC